jgi:hypothetical protein
VCKKRVRNTAQHFTLRRAPISHRVLMEGRRNFSAEPKFLPSRHLLSVLCSLTILPQIASLVAEEHLIFASSALSDKKKQPDVYQHRLLLQGKMTHLFFLSRRAEWFARLKEGKWIDAVQSLWHILASSAEINILSRTAFNDFQEFSLEWLRSGKIISCQKQKNDRSERH